MSGGKGITPRAENYSQWYVDIVQKADLADYSAVRGCMVIKPHGYAMWEHMQGALDRMFKETGHVNAYFPLFIPKSFLAREAAHIEGFAKECAVVTHHRLKADPDHGIIVDPEAKLEEELIVRPTSETIIWNTYKGWIQSWRDLPLLINQWANVVRWEMRPRLFLRTAEFLWQEGHTAHATAAEAEEEALRMLGVYRDFMVDWLRVPVVTGPKSESEKFAGAAHTYTLEALTQDLRAIQAGTSHNLGQSFAKAFDVTFQTAEGKLEHVWATSWGVSTRMVGMLIMSHSDDQGLVAPPRVAPVQVVIVPIGRGEGLEAATAKCRELEAELKKTVWMDHPIRVKLDDRDKLSPGFKFNEWELKGACLRIELGPRDLEAGHCLLASRLGGDKKEVALADVAQAVAAGLDEINEALFARALAHREAHTKRVETWEEFKKCFDGEGGGGFVLAHWDGTPETEARIVEETKATIRCMPQPPLNPGDEEPGKCVLTGAPSARRVVFAKSY